MGEDTTAEQQHQARILVAAGITPGAELSEPARAALATLEAQPDETVERTACRRPQRG